MVKVYKNIIDQNLINKLNYMLDEYNYTDSLYLYSNTHDQFFSKIKKDILNHEIFKKNISEDIYLVIRCVNENDTKRLYDLHFDNYLDTWLVPIKIPKKSPKGELYIWENSRKTSSNILSHIINKLFYQNFFFRYLIKNKLISKFKKYDCEPGDVVHFNGFNSLHFNQEVSDERRSLLIHMNRGIKNSKIIDFSEKLSQIF